MPGNSPIGKFKERNRGRIKADNSNIDRKLPDPLPFTLTASPASLALLLALVVGVYLVLRR